MSDYYLADHKAAERARQRDSEREPREPREPTRAENIKVTLLGDFMFPTTEPAGCDPYNSTQGKAMRDAWPKRRERR
jgi:hypothetical protein